MTSPKNREVGMNNRIWIKEMNKEEKKMAMKVMMMRIIGLGLLLRIRIERF